MAEQNRIFSPAVFLDKRPTFFPVICHTCGNLPCKAVPHIALVACDYLRLVFTRYFNNRRALGVTADLNGFYAAANLHFLIKGADIHSISQIAFSRLVFILLDIKGGVFKVFGTLNMVVVGVGDNQIGYCLG